MRKAIPLFLILAITACGGRQQESGATMDEGGMAADSAQMGGEMMADSTQMGGGMVGDSSQMGDSAQMGGGMMDPDTTGMTP
ncbi:MAG: hypothetical protein PVJ02_15705 [Gemmatimonadota bacterium]|jgi:hypothetical protein